MSPAPLRIERHRAQLIGLFTACGFSFLIGFIAGMAFVAITTIGGC